MQSPIRQQPSTISPKPRTYDLKDWQQGYSSQTQELDCWLNAIEGEIPRQGSGLSIFYLWIKTLETDTSLSRRELPIYRLLGMIALSVPSRCFLL